jgi:phosphate transport system substrate-binding protein
MTAATWILLYKQPKDAAASASALTFFDWAYTKGGKMADELHYVPMPENVVKDIEQYWKSEIKDSAGKPLFAAM